MEIGRTYQFRPSKDSEGDPKNEAKKRLVKCFFFLKKKKKKNLRSQKKLPIKIEKYFEITEPKKKKKNPKAEVRSRGQISRPAETSKTKSKQVKAMAFHQGKT